MGNGGEREVHLKKGGHTIRDDHQKMGGISLCSRKCVGGLNGSCASQKGSPLSMFLAPSLRVLTFATNLYAKYEDE